MLQVHRQCGEVGGFAGEHDGLRRRLRARDFDDLRRVAKATSDFADEALGRSPKGPRDPGATARDIADELLPFWTDSMKQNGARIAIEGCRDVRQIDRLVVAFHSVIIEALDETAQAEPLGLRSVLQKILLLDDLHAVPPDCEL